MEVKVDVSFLIIIHLDKPASTRVTREGTTGNPRRSRKTKSKTRRLPVMELDDKIPIPIPIPLVPVLPSCVPCAISTPSVLAFAAWIEFRSGLGSME